MTTERMKLTAESRGVGGKGVLTALRRGGKIPAVLYGRGRTPLPVSLNVKELIHSIRSSGLNALIDLSVAGHQEKKPLVVMVKDLQTELISRQILHVDLVTVDLKEKINVSVPVRLTGKSAGVTQGGVIDQPRREIEVRCLPGSIPEAIEIDITPLEIGDIVHIDDLKLPPGVEAPHETNFAVVSVIMPKEEALPEVAAPAAEAAPAAAEGAPPAAGPTAGAPPAAGGEVQKKGEKKEEK